MQPIQTTHHPRVVIIGGGFGGIELAKKLKNKPFEVLMLDKNNYHTFQPLLYQVAMGDIEADSIAFPIRKIFAGQKNFSFRMAAVTQLQITKCDSWRAGTRLPRAVPHRVNDELVEVYAFPSHRDLNDAMKLT